MSGLLAAFVIYCLLGILLKPKDAWVFGRLHWLATDNPSTKPSQLMAVAEEAKKSTHDPGVIAYAAELQEWAKLATKYCGDETIDFENYLTRRAGELGSGMAPLMLEPAKLDAIEYMAATNAQAEAANTCWRKYIQVRPDPLVILPRVILAAVLGFGIYRFLAHLTPSSQNRLN